MFADFENQWTAAPPVADLHEQTIRSEDRRIVESQRGDVLSEPEEISVGTDAPSVAFRRFYAELK